VREPPADLADSTVVACLNADYGRAISELTFLPLGHDSSAWVYLAQGVDAAYFVKVRIAIVNEAGLMVPRHLAERGVGGVVAPLAARDGRLSATAGRYAVIVYPFVNGGTAMDLGMTDEQWVRYGELVRAVHDTTLATELEGVLRRETFAPDGGAAVERLDSHIADGHFEDPLQAQVAAFWSDNRAKIRPLLDQCRDLGRALARANPPPVLCHADIHTNNVLVDDHGDLWIVDWDEAMLAPRERDLMFAVGGIHETFVSQSQTKLFLSGYGEVEIGPVALAYYRYAWAVGDIGAYGEQVFFRPDLGPASTQEAAARFVSLFDQESIVEIALGSALSH
jgi:spectinomycin phosphotransferase